MVTVFRAIGTLRRFARHPSLGRDAFVDYQNRQLRRLIPHAYANVPYYRRLFDEHGLKPADIRTVDDLPRIPITSRDVLQQLPAEQIVARGVDHRRLIAHNTSGSSGKPLTIRRTWVEERLLGALRWRSFRMLGLRARDRLCIIAASTIPDLNQREALQGIVRALGFFNRRTVDGFAPPETIATALRALRPDVVGGPPAVLTRVVTTLHPGTLRSLGVRFVTCGAEILAPWSRAQIEEAFGAPVYDHVSEPTDDLPDATEAQGEGGEVPAHALFDQHRDQVDEHRERQRAR